MILYDKPIGGPIPKETLQNLVKLLEATIVRLESDALEGKISNTPNNDTPPNPDKIAAIRNVVTNALQAHKVGIIDTDAACHDIDLVYRAAAVGSKAKIFPEDALLDNLKESLSVDVERCLIDEEYASLVGYLVEELIGQSKLSNEFSAQVSSDSFTPRVLTALVNCNALEPLYAYVVSTIFRALVAKTAFDSNQETPSNLV